MIYLWEYIKNRENIKNKFEKNKIYDTIKTVYLSSFSKEIFLHFKNK